jgi:preprotein translocase subunit SecG
MNSLTLILRVFLALLLLLLLVPQTTKLNLLLRLFNESGFFSTYREAGRVLVRVTWSTIFLFLIVTYFAAR